jgi:hypothetical protein
MSPLVKASLACVVAVALAACNRNGPGRELIANRCVAGGETPEVCKCLADQSSAKLDDEMFQLVVLAAQGQVNASERLLRDIGPDRQSRFRTITREVARACGATEYLVAN